MNLHAVASDNKGGSMRSRKTQAVVGIGRDLSARAHRQLIGYLGLLLPILLYLLAGLRSTKGLEPWKLLTSVSAYYYTGGIGIFIGVLFALSLFLFSYRGYEGEKVDRFLGKVAGIAALGVPLFPTEPPLELLKPSWWTPIMDKLHLISATVLFGSFILFALWLFRKSRISRFRDRPKEKRTRDTVCLFCGIAMILSMIWAGVASVLKAPIFWPETVAIEAFGVSWLTKGEAHVPFVRIARILTSAQTK
jgi:hypothetical protein